MIDTHTHLYLQENFPYGDGYNAVIRAEEVGVNYMIFPNVNLETLEPMFSLHRQFRDCTAVAIGLHPTEVGEGWNKQLDLIYTALEKTLKTDDIKVVAIGEVGIDLYWDKSYRMQQIQVLDKQLHWAEEFKLPVIVHCREGVSTIIDVIKNYNGELPKLIFHSFTGTAEEVRLLRQFGDHYFGVNGVVTFKNAESVREAVLEIGLHRLLLETDSPYLAPVPKRGQRNESSYLQFIANKLAELFSVSTDNIDIVTTSNAHRVFEF